MSSSEQCANFDLYATLFVFPRSNAFANLHSLFEYNKESEE